jgi:hypothetical protein
VQPFARSFQHVADAALDSLCPIIDLPLPIPNPVERVAHGAPLG